MPTLSELRSRTVALAPTPDDAENGLQECLVSDTRSGRKSSEVIEQKLHAALERRGASVSLRPRRIKKPK